MEPTYLDYDKREKYGNELTQLFTNKNIKKVTVHDDGQHFRFIFDDNTEFLIDVMGQDSETYISIIN